MTDRQQPPERRPIFTLKIEGRPGIAGIRSLRWLLKTLFRQHGFRALDVREDVPQSFSKNRTGRAAGKQKDDDNDVST
jgi:hypothetical protein